MRVSFHSSHVTGDYSNGRLTVFVTIEDDVRQISETREIFFSVPPDFHAHNDLVAAALMAIPGRGFDETRFNFPVSAHCAATLPIYNRCGEVSPVDPDLEPRRPGKYIGVTFSGGLDSLAVLTLLRDCAGMDVKVITAEYEGYHRESVGYASYPRDVSCHTDYRLRRKFGDRGSRIDVVVPLLFADYADLHSFATGHDFSSDRWIWADPRDDPVTPPAQAAVPEAGGLRELHIARCMHTSGLLRFLAIAAPERVEAGFHVTAPPGTLKYFAKALMLRHVYRELERELPPFLADLKWERVYEGMPVERVIYLWTIWKWRFLDRYTANRADRRVASIDWSPLEDLPLAFFWKYCQRTAQLLPPEVREPVLAGLRANGIEPYTDQDYDELEAVRQFIIAVNPPSRIAFA